MSQSMCGLDESWQELWKDRSGDMAPRKRRGGPTAAPSTPTSWGSSPKAARAGVIDVEADVQNVPPGLAKSSPVSLGSVLAYYSTLTWDSGWLDFRPDASIWLYHCAGVVAINVAMYDLRIQVDQFGLLVWSGLWLGRHFFLAHIIGARSQNGKRSVLVWRTALLAVFAGAAISLQTPSRSEISEEFAMHVGVIAFLDAASMGLEMSVPTPRLPFVEMVRLIEVIFVVTTFSTYYNQRPSLIVDKSAIVVILISMVTHHFVLVGVKLALSKAPWTDEHSSTVLVQRQRIVIEQISRAVGLELQREPALNHEAAANRSRNSEDKTTIFFGLRSPVGDEVAKKKTYLLPGDVRGSVLALILLQSVTVSFQVIACTTIVHFWELCTAFMCTSIHLLVQLQVLHASLLRSNSPCTSIGCNASATCSCRLNR